MKTRPYNLAAHAFCAWFVVLSGTGVSLAAPPEHSEPAAVEHATNRPPPASASPAESARPGPPAHTVSSTPAAANHSAANASPTDRNQTESNGLPTHTGVKERHDDGDHRRLERSNAGIGYYYPLGYGYNYWDPNWSPYSNGSQYPGQFVQSNQSDAAIADQAPDAQPAPDVVPSAPADASPSLDAALTASPQWREADAQVRIAQGKYDAAMERVKARLQNDPAYQAALASKSQEAQQLTAIQLKNPTPSIDRTAPAATAKLDAAQTLTKIENAAVLADPQASAAKNDLDTAIAHRNEIRQAIEAALPKAAPSPVR